MEKSVYYILKGLAALPFTCLYAVSDIITFLLQKIIRYRKNVVRNNLTSSFPEKDLKEIKKIERDFYRYLGDQFVETLKLLHISDKELQKRVKVYNQDEVNDSLARGKNAVLLMGHYGNWEWVQEITRHLIPSANMVSIYQPLASKSWDHLFLRIRSRWHAHILPSNKALHTLLDKDKFPWVCGFISDQRPGPKTEKNCTQFLNHTTYFVFGSEDVGRRTGADFFYLEMKKKKRGYYDIIFHRLCPEDLSVTYPYTREFWKKFEKTIKESPAYWLWSHRRWQGSPAPRTV